MRRDSGIAARYESFGAGTAYAGTLQSWATPKYMPPVGLNLLVYLQDMSPRTGPLRVVKRSHLGQPALPTGAARNQPHPDEVLLDMAAGDLIVMHGEMIHSGTANAVDSAIRAYVSTFVTRVGWPHRDDFGTPVRAPAAADPVPAACSVLSCAWRRRSGPVLASVCCFLLCCRVRAFVCLTTGCRWLSHRGRCGC